VKTPSFDPIWETWRQQCLISNWGMVGALLGLSNGTLYRMIHKPPTVAMRYAMAAIYHHQLPYTGT
jgi:hypothetical protein